MVVMPVYNEAECIGAVVDEWHAQLVALDLNFEILVLNDGSKDNTAQVLERFEADAHVRVENKANSGHGPTILHGYRQAVERAPWVFQVDSDDEMKPGAFASLWHKREKYDALLGFRHNREQDAARRVLSLGSRAVVKLLFGRGVRDVNTPYRLLRSSILAPIIARIPPDTFAPNVIISGVLSRRRGRLYNHPVPHEGRKTGTASLVSSKLWKVAFRSLWQTARFFALDFLKRSK